MAFRQSLLPLRLASRLFLSLFIVFLHISGRLSLSFSPSYISLDYHYARCLSAIIAVDIPLFRFLHDGFRLILSILPGYIILLEYFSLVAVFAFGFHITTVTLFTTVISFLHFGHLFHFISLLPFAFRSYTFSSHWSFSLIIITLLMPLAISSVISLIPFMY